MAATTQGTRMVFRVIDAMDLPHTGRMIRLRLQTGHPLPIRQIRGGRFLATSPSGEVETLQVMGFATVGGRPSDGRFTRTGRLDLLVTLEDGDARPRVTTRWEVSGPM